MHDGRPHTVTPPRKTPPCPTSAACRTTSSVVASSVAGGASDVRPGRRRPRWTGRRRPWQRGVLAKPRCRCMHQPTVGTGRLMQANNDEQVSSQRSCDKRPKARPPRRHARTHARAAAAPAAAGPPGTDKCGAGYLWCTGVLHPDFGCKHDSLSTHHFLPFLHPHTPRLFPP